MIGRIGETRRWKSLFAIPFLVSSDAKFGDAIAKRAIFKGVMMRSKKECLLGLRTQFSHHL